MLPRRLLSAALLGLVVALAGCGRTYFGQALDPSAANVVPPLVPDATTLETSAPADAMTPGVEGSVLFIRLTTADGQRVLDRPFAWPADRQPVPPGDYRLSAYWRVCDGNCGHLDAESPPFCSLEVVAAPRGRITLEILPSDLEPGSSCALHPAS